MKKIVAMLNTITITSSVTNFVVACNTIENKSKNNIKNKNPELKGEIINIDKITIDEILNVRTKYKGKDDQNKNVTVKSDKLGALSKKSINGFIEDNLYIMIRRKIAGFNKSFVEDGSENPNDAEIKNHTIWKTFLRNNINIKSKASNETDDTDRSFKVTITLKKWDEIKTNIEKELTELKEKADSELKMSEEQMKKKWEEEGIDQEFIEKGVKFRIQYFKVVQKMSLDSIKSMYDLIQINEGTRTIDVDLNSKK